MGEPKNKNEPERDGRVVEHGDKFSKRGGAEMVSTTSTSDDYDPGSSSISAPKDDDEG